jgi:hypothetical protein
LPASSGLRIVWSPGALLPNAWTKSWRELVGKRAYRGVVPRSSKRRSGTSYRRSVAQCLRRIADGADFRGARLSFHRDLGLERSSYTPAGFAFVDTVANAREAWSTSATTLRL